LEGKAKVCLAKAFVENSVDQPVLQDIALVTVQGDRVELETLFGERKVLSGRLLEIDFTNSTVLLGPPDAVGAQT
jgi:predicted RNA-binding protein